MAILEGRFGYFCRAECKQAYLRAQGRPPEEHVVTARPPEVTRSHVSRPHGQPVTQHLPDDPLQPLDVSSLILPHRPDLEPIRATIPPPKAPPQSHGWSRAGSRRRTDALAAFDAIGIVCGVLVPAIGLLGPVVDWARIPLILAAWTALALRVLVQGRDAADPHPLVVLVPAAGAVVAACWASAIHEPRAVSLAVFAALSCATAVAVEMVVERARIRVRAARDRIGRALDVRVRIAHGDDKIDRPASEVRPGEPIVVEPGELVGVDATVTAGEARVVPWLGANVELVRREGDPVLAGARVVSNAL
ncbi:MAG TPA: hypothetical protein VN894_04175, partial [Polyangiaceae bacterium]|nr:hypothetical protein [Polyangiaceae bacterium]